MTIDLDARWPHTDDLCGEGINDSFECHCDRDARIAAHIERLEGALREIRDGDMLTCEFRPHPYHCVRCDGVDPDHEKGCPVPAIEVLLADLGSGTAPLKPEPN